MSYDIEEDTDSSDSNMWISDNEYDDNEDDNEDNDDEVNDYEDIYNKPNNVNPDVAFAQPMEVNKDFGPAVDEEDLCYTNKIGDEDDSDEANLSAYVMDSTSQPTEQDGVLHVVHGWIQQALPEKVSGPYVNSYIC